MLVSWADYHLDNPTFCTPFIVALGLTKALYERELAACNACCYGFWSWEDYVQRIFRGFSAPFSRADYIHYMSSVSGREFTTNFEQRFCAAAWGWEWLDYEICRTQACLNSCPGLQENICPRKSPYFVDEHGDYITVRSMLDAIGDSELIDIARSNVFFRPSLFVPWAVQRIKMLKQLRRVRVKYSPFHLTLAEGEWTWSDNEHLFMRQSAVDSIVPHTVDGEAYYGYPEFRCITQMVYGDLEDEHGDWIVECQSAQMRVPVSGRARYYADEEEPEEYFLNAPRAGSGTLYINAGALDNYSDFNPLCSPVHEGINTFELDSDGFFFRDWPTSITLPDGLPERGAAVLGWEIKEAYSILDFNSNFEFQE